MSWFLEINTKKRVLQLTAKIFLFCNTVMCLFLYLAGSSDNGEEESASFKQIFSNANIVITLLLTVFIGSLWTIIDPILEPELRDKVCV